MDKPEPVYCGDCRIARLDILVYPVSSTQELSYNATEPFWKWVCSCGWSHWRSANLALSKINELTACLRKTSSK